MSLHPSVAVVRGAVRSQLAQHTPGDVVIVACSGGPDSMALLSATVFEGHKQGLHVVGVTVDHGLQDGSAANASRVVEQMARLGADETLTATVRVEAEGMGPEAAARTARYAVLEEVAQRLASQRQSEVVVLLGHTLDDQAETVLLGLARGSGGRSLAGMRPSFAMFARPLLGVRRDDTVTACQVEGIEVWNDPHNTDPGFTRVRVRLRVLPALERELGPGVTQALARTAQSLREDTEFLDALADEAHARLDHPLPVAGLAELPAALRRRVLRLAALAAGAPAAELFREHVQAVDALVIDWHGQKWIDLPGGVRALRRDARLVFESSSQPA